MVGFHSSSCNNKRATKKASGKYAGKCACLETQSLDFADKSCGFISVMKKMLVVLQNISNLYQ